MEIHSVLPEERARNEKGETLPWAYRYPDGSKNTRAQEESGPFGRNRSIRYTSSSIGVGRRHSTRSGTTPSRPKENPAVNDFSRIFAKEQASKVDQSTAPAPAESADSVPVEKTPTECLIYGYAGKNSEWKVINRFERIAAPGIICEDYDREDPKLYQNSASPMGFNRSNMTVHKNLSKDALAKARHYRGGQHWIKVTFDSYEAAERACYYSPIEVDGCSVKCEYWNGKGPMADVPVPRGAENAVAPLLSAQKAQTVGTAGGRASALAGFEQAMSSATLPRGHHMPDAQYSQPIDDFAVDDSVTASSGTVNDIAPERSGLRSRSVPKLPSQNISDPSSQYMTHAPKVRKAVLRPITEALPPRQSNLERILRVIPVVSWLLGYSSGARVDGGGDKGDKGLIGEGPVLKDDGSWDNQANGWYWSLWYRCDRILGSDFCGLKDEST